MAPQHYANNLIVKTCKVADVYDDGSFNDMFDISWMRPSSTAYATTGEQYCKND